MNIIAVIGAFIMTLAFLAYGVGSVTLERFRMVGTIVLMFFSLGLLFEVAAIILMLTGAEGSSMGSWHGIVGAAAFLLMLVNTIWVWAIYIREGIDGGISAWLLNYTKGAYFIWVVAYLLGIILIIWF